MYQRMTRVATAARLTFMRTRFILSLGLTLMLFYSLQRGLFLFWNWELYKELEVSLIFQAAFRGLRFDLVVVSWILMITFLWGWLVRRWLWLPVLLMSLSFYILSLIDNELWNFFGRRLTGSILQMFSEAQGKTGAMAGLYLHWIFLGLFLCVPFLLIFYKITKNEKPFQWGGFSSLGTQLVVILFLVLAARGGFQKKPLSLAQSHHFQNSLLNLLTLNTTFTVVKSFSSKGLEKVQFMSSEKAHLFMNKNLSNAEFVNIPELQTQKQNVVILILESFSSEYTSLKSQNRKSHTPFLDELIKQSLVFPNALANGRRSIEGIAAILAGIPSLMDEPFISSEYSTHKIEGIGSNFVNSGYQTSFFHGGENGTMHFDSFTEKLGFQNYFGSQQYPDQKDFDGVWGIWDRPYLKYFANEVSKMKSPFFTVLFTLSSHQPYLVPGSEKDRFPEQPEHPILKSISYSDQALKDFFEMAKRQLWYNQTLFILVADHTGPVVFANPKNPLSSYQIPIVFFHPQIKVWPKEIDTSTLAQQIDLPATLYDLLGMKQAKTTVFGRSLLRSGPRNWTVFNGGNTYFTNGKKILIESGNSQTFLSFENLQNVEASPSMIETLKANQQVFSEAMWGNQLYR